MLETKYGGKDVKDRLELRQRHRSIVFRKGDSMMNHLARIQEVADQLTAAGGELPEDDIVLTILQSLPREYDIVNVTLRTRGKAVTLEKLHKILLTEERRLNFGVEKDEKESVYYADKGRGNTKGRTCFTCGKRVHLSKACKEEIAVDGRLLCRICKSRDHLQRSCPKNSSNGRGRPSATVGVRKTTLQLVTDKMQKRSTCPISMNREIGKTNGCLTPAQADTCIVSNCTSSSVVTQTCI